MKERFINSSLEFIKKYEKCDDIKILRLKYGLEGIYNLVVKLIVVLILAIILNTLKETALFLLFYAFIRTFSFGLHSKSSLACWITTIAIYNVIPFFAKNYIVPNIIGYIVIILAFISMLMWAPADTPKRPLIRKETRLRCKIISTFVVIIYLIIYALNINTFINNAITYALITQIIFINPVTYKLTKTKFNNYKYYKKPTMV